jgi:hypothetical protein
MNRPDADELLARAIAARLAAPVEPDLRARHVAAAAAASAGAAAEGGSAGDAAAPDRHARGRSTRPRRVSWSPRGALVPLAGLTAAAAALVVVLPGVTGPPSIRTDAGLAAASGRAADPAIDAAPEAAMADAGPAATSMMVEVRFVLADGLVAPAARAGGWRLEPPGDLASATARLADAFALAPPRPSDWDPSTLVAEGPGGALLVVAPSGQWSFAGPSGAPGPSGTDSAGADVAGTDVPSAADAERLTRELLERAGITGVRITATTSDAFGAAVDGELVVAGAPAGTRVPFLTVLGPGDRPTFAMGTLARPRPTRDYRTADLATALARLGTVDDGAAAGRTDGADPAAGGPGIVVRIVAVELVVAEAFGTDGSVLLVPHYRLTDADGGTWEVLAVDDRHFER